MVDENQKAKYNSSVPSYVSVYNLLYSDIMDGVYVQTQLLPSEMSLSSKYNVSRNTLRQALAILCEDGLIIKSRGKGTVVAKRSESEFLKNTFNPMTKLCNEKVSNVSYNYNFNPPTDIARKKLNLNSNDIIIASNNIYKTENTIIGFSFIQIPIKIFDDLEIDSSNEDDIKMLMDKKIFKAATKANVKIKLIFANEIEVGYLGVEENMPLLLMEMILYNVKLQPFARCKFYFNPKYYNLQFQM